MTDDLLMRASDALGRDWHGKSILAAALRNEAKIQIDREQKMLLRAADEIDRLNRHIDGMASIRR